MSAETLIEWTGPNGTRRILIECLSSGMFRYCEEHFVVDDETAEGGGIYEYWRPMGVSGLYPSAIDAQNDAATRFVWLGSLLQDPANRL